MTDRGATGDLPDAGDDPLGPAGLHGAAVAFGHRAVLIRGASGSGKSAFALALLARRLFDGTPARLLADDRVRLRREEGNLVAFAPDALRGLLEVRGVGLLRLAVAEPAALALAIELVDVGPERLPAPARAVIAGVALPCVRWPKRESATGADLAVALLSGAEILDPDRI